MPKISVILPVRNGAQYLSEAIQSVIDQTFTDWELLILDHGSTDETLSIATASAERDKRIRVHHMGHISSLAALLNEGLRTSDSQYVMRQDADDLSLPERMNYLIRAFEASPLVSVIGSEGFVIDGSGRRTGEFRLPTHPDWLAVASIFCNPFNHPSCAFRRDDLLRLGAQYGNSFINASDPLQIPELAEDYFLMGQLAILKRGLNLPVELIAYRWHSTNVSKLRHQEMMEKSVHVARYLAKAFSVIHSSSSFDPIPFCTFGECPFELHDATDLAEQYAYMSNSLQRGMGSSKHVIRELAFRKVLSTRSIVSMGIRFKLFENNYNALPMERRSVLNFAKRRLRWGKIPNENYSLF